MSETKKGICTGHDGCYSNQFLRLEIPAKVEHLPCRQGHQATNREDTKPEDTGVCRFCARREHTKVQRGLEGERERAEERARLSPNRHGHEYPMTSGNPENNTIVTE